MDIDVMRVFVTRDFRRFARKAKIDDQLLCDAITRAQRGLIDADLGGGVINQRVARPGQGRSGGYRTLLAFRSEDRAVFLVGFAKKDKDNIDDDDLMKLRRASAVVLGLSEADLAIAIAEKRMTEVDCEEEDLSQQDIESRAFGHVRPV